VCSKRNLMQLIAFTFTVVVRRTFARKSEGLYVCAGETLQTCRGLDIEI